MSTASEARAEHAASTLRPAGVENLHPHWRYIGLSHIRQVRMMLRERRHVIDCERIIKTQQRNLLAIRRSLAV